MMNWLRSLWNKWFKDSEVNLAADALAFIGAAAELLVLVADEPGFKEFLEGWGVTPAWLFIIGVGFRVLRRVRDPEMRVSP